MHLHLWPKWHDFVMVMHSTNHLHIQENLNYTFKVPLLMYRHDLKIWNIKIYPFVVPITIHLRWEYCVIEWAREIVCVCVSECLFAFCYVVPNFLHVHCVKMRRINVASVPLGIDHDTPYQSHISNHRKCFLHYYCQLLVFSVVHMPMFN